MQQMGRHFSEIFVPWAIKSKEVEIRNQTIKALWWHHITLADNFRYFTRLLRMFYFFKFLGMIWFSWTILSNINDYVTMCAFNHIVIKGMCLNYRTSVHGIMVLMVWIVVLTKDVATVGKRMNEIKLKCSFMVNKGWSKRGYYISRSVWYDKYRHLAVGLPYKFV